MPVTNGIVEYVDFMRNGTRAIDPFNDRSYGRIVSISQIDGTGHRYNYPLVEPNYEVINVEIGDTISYYQMNRTNCFGTSDISNVVDARVTLVELDGNLIHLDNGYQIHPYFIKTNSRYPNLCKMNVNDNAINYLFNDTPFLNNDDYVIRIDYGNIDRSYVFRYDPVTLTISDTGSVSFSQEEELSPYQQWERSIKNANIA